MWKLHVIQFGFLPVLVIGVPLLAFQFCDIKHCTPGVQEGDPAQQDGPQGCAGAAEEHPGLHHLDTAGLP